MARIEFHTGKKLDKKEDLEPLLKQLTSETKELSLQGNSLSVYASELIGNALNVELSYLDIHDCFTGRLKTDVPLSIDHLLRNCPNLTEIDICDNALSVLGAKHLSYYIQDSKLEIIKISNTGIGIEGVKHIANGLNKYCQHHETPPLREFHCGRNRLESGSQFLAVELAKCTELRVLRLFQNGIRPDFIKFLSFQLRGTKSELGLSKLTHLDLQDNSFMLSGSKAFATELLPVLKELQILNVGECLTKDAGGVYILKELVKLKHLQLVDMTYNELFKKSLQLIYKEKAFWKHVTLHLNGNVFDPESELALQVMDSIKTDEWDDMELPDSDEEEEEEEE